MLKKTQVLASRLLIVCVLIALAACADQRVEVYSYFENSQDIERGAALYLDNSAVGEVTDTVAKDNGQFVTVVIDEQAAAKINKQAAIVVNRLKPGAPLEIHNSAEASEYGLSDGDQLDGLDSTMQLLAWSVGDALTVGTNEIGRYIDSFTDYLNSEQFEQDKQTIQTQVKTAANQTVEAFKDIDKEITSVLDQAQANEQQLAAAIEELGQHMSPLVEDIAATGAKLANELEQFTEGLEQQSIERQVSGAQFLDRLATTLENLNRSLESGLRAEQDEKQSDQHVDDQQQDH